MLVSAETLNGGWVGMGEWVVTGCVVLPLFLESLSLLSDARLRTNLAWWRVGTGRWVLIGG